MTAIKPSRAAEASSCAPSRAPEPSSADSREVRAEDVAVTHNPLKQRAPDTGRARAEATSSASADHAQQKIRYPSRVYSPVLILALQEFKIQ